MPFQNFRAADGWFVLGAAKQKFWESVCAVIGQPELNDDPRFATMAARNENRDALLPILDAAFATRTVDEWIAALVAPASPRRGSTRSRRRSSTRRRSRARTSSTTTIPCSARCGRSARRCGCPTATSRSSGRGRGPLRGEHTAEVLTSICGYAPEKVRSLAAAGVFGDVVVEP